MSANTSATPAPAATPAPDKYGNPSHFMTEAEILKYRAITTLLHATNAIDKDIASKGTMFDYAERAERDRKAQIYRRLANLTDLLPRHHEIIAVAPAADLSSIRVTEAEEKIEEELEQADEEVEEEMEEAEEMSAEPKTFVYTNNPIKDDVEKKPGDGPVSKGCKALRSEVQSQATLDIGHSPGKYLLMRTSGTKTGRGIDNEKPRTDLTMGEHGAILLTLLRKTYTSKETNYTSEHTRLHRYVIINSLAKIHGRMKRGSGGKRQFLEHLKKTPDELPDLLDARMAKETFGEDHTFSKSEKGALRQIITMLKRDESFDLEPLKVWIDAFSNDTDIVYDSASSYAFQYLLSSVVKRFTESTNALYTLKDNLQLKRLAEEPDDATLDAWGTQLDRAADEVCEAMWILSIIKDKAQLRFILRKHLTWLLNLPDIPSTDLGGFMHETPKNRGREINNLSSDITNSSSDGRSHDQPPTSDPYRRLDSDLDESGNFNEYSDSSEDEEDDRHDQIYASDYHNIDASIVNNDRPEAIIKYLDLTCLHLTAMMNLSAGEDSPLELQQFMLNATLEWIRHYHDEPDRGMMTLDALLKEIKKDNGEKLTVNEVDKIVKPWLEKHNDYLRPEPPKAIDPKIAAILSKPHEELDQEERGKKRKHLLKQQQKPKPGKYERDGGFSGNSHAGSLLLTDHLIKRAGNKIISTDESEKLDHLLLPPKEVTDRMEEILQILPVSKRCCPACFELVKYVQDEQEKEILYPGNHTTWTATTFPSNIPRPAGLRVLNFAETTLRRRLTKIIERVESNPAGADISSGGTNPANDATSTPKKKFGAPAMIFRRGSRGEADRDVATSTGSGSAATSAPSLTADTAAMRPPPDRTAGVPGSPTKKHGRDISFHDRKTKPRLGTKENEAGETEDESEEPMMGEEGVKEMEGMEEVSGEGQTED